MSGTKWYFKNFEKLWKWKRKMKMKNFFPLNENFSYSLYKNFNLSCLQICNHLFVIFPGTKDTACQNWSKTGILSLLWKAVSFDPEKILRRWLHIWNQLSLKFSVCSIMKTFSCGRKKVQFFHLHYSSSFSQFFEFSKYHIVPLKIPF